MSPKRAREHRRDPATESFRRGLALLGDLPLFGPLLLRASVARSAGGRCPADGWALVTTNGRIDAHTGEETPVRFDPEERALVAVELEERAAREARDGPVRRLRLEEPGEEIGALG